MKQANYARDITARKAARIKIEYTDDLFENPLSERVAGRVDVKEGMFYTGIFLVIISMLS